MSKEKSKEPLLSVVYNSFCPGLGHIYGGAKVRGILIILFILFFLIMNIYWVMHPTFHLSFLSGIKLREEMILFLILLTAFLFEGVVLVDGYYCTIRFNRENNCKREINTIKKILFIISALIILVGFNMSRIIGTIVKSRMYEAFRIPSGVMAPAMLEGDRFLVNKYRYLRSKPKRGDVIVFVSPKNKQENLFFRIVGLGEEKLEIKDGRIFINGKAVLNSKIDSREYINSGFYGEKGSEVHIPKDHYYVLGDNSLISDDSRYWGFVPKETIIGPAYKLYFPFSRSGPIL